MVSVIIIMLLIELISSSFIYLFDVCDFMQIRQLQMEVFYIMHSLQFLEWGPKHTQNVGIFESPSVWNPIVE